MVDQCQTVYEEEKPPVGQLWQRFNFGNFDQILQLWYTLAALTTFVSFGKGPTNNIWIYRFENRLEHCVYMCLYFVLDGWQKIKRTSTRDPDMNCLRKPSPTLDGSNITGEGCDKWLSANLSWFKL